MAITDEIKRLQLGESLEKIVKNTDSNFVSLFDTVDQLDEAVRGIVEASEAMIFKGTLGTGGTITSLPTKHSAGDTYKVITAGVYAGKNCNVGDLIICIKDSNGDGSNTDTHWTVFESNPDGSVTSSSTSSTDKHIAVFDGSSGRIIKDSGLTIGVSVPADAKFTDTTYEVATTGRDGLLSKEDKKKLVPATENAIGLMSAEDKKKLDGLNKYVLPAAGDTLGGVKKGGDVTIDKGIITVTSIGGESIDQIGKIKDIQINGETVDVDENGVANIELTIADLESGYMEIPFNSIYWVPCYIENSTGEIITGENGRTPENKEAFTKYHAIKIVETDIPLEMYDKDGHKILTHTVRKNNHLYICVSTTTPAQTYTLRTVSGNAMGNGSGSDSYVSGLYRHNLHISSAFDNNEDIVQSTGIISGEYHAYATIISHRGEEYSGTELSDFLGMMGAAGDPVENEFSLMMYPASGFVYLTAYKKEEGSEEWSAEEYKYTEAVPCGLFSDGSKKAYCWFGGSKDNNANYVQIVGAMNADNQTDVVIAIE